MCGRGIAAIAIPAFVALAIPGCPAPPTGDGDVAPADGGADVPALDAPVADGGLDAPSAPLDAPLDPPLDAASLDDGGECAPRCELAGATACTAEGNLRRCVAVAPTCAIWVEIPCPTVLPCGERPAGAACGGACTDDCDPAATPVCIDGAPAACADYDDDPCNELWVGELPCPALGAVSCVSPRDRWVCERQADGCQDWARTVCAPGEACDAASGTCTCIDQCPLDGLTDCGDHTSSRRCADRDGDGCLEWGDETACVAPATCEGGRCSTSCTDQCSGTGSVVCYPGGRARICGHHDADPCRELGPERTCPEGTLCDVRGTEATACVECLDATDCAPDVALCTAGECAPPPGTCFAAAPGSLSVLVPAGAPIDEVGLFLGLSGLSSPTASSFFLTLQAPDGTSAYVDRCGGVAAGEIYRDVLDAADAPALAELAGGPRGGTWTLTLRPCATGGPRLDVWAVCLSP